jgi:protein-L-isoaspartate(D-aspartate) O-methyltransferase
MKRRRMVEDQIERRGVRSRAVLDAMLRVERHRFVPESEQQNAYDDNPLPIGEGQTISQPYIVGLMTDLLELKPDDKALEIGTGSGYQAAVLAEIVSEVYTIEIVEKLGLRAKALLEELGYDKIHVRIGDGYKGWPEEAPFDGIIVTASPDHIPQPLIDQLAEGGRMVIPVGPRWDQQLLVLEKKNGEIRTRPSIPVRFVPMTGEAQEKEKEKEKEER